MDETETKRIFHQGLIALREINLGYPSASGKPTLLLPLPHAVTCRPRLRHRNSAAENRDTKGRGNGRGPPTLPQLRITACNRCDAMNVSYSKGNIPWPTRRMLTARHQKSIIWTRGAPGVIIIFMLDMQCVRLKLRNVDIARKISSLRQNACMKGCFWGCDGMQLLADSLF